jgi:peptidoglycan/xylan/chitin deacetylase (PgdA/CDA1 family)
MAAPPEAAPGFHWPDGKRAAVSLTFDDARPSQVDTGIPILNKYGLKGTFFLSPGNIPQRLDGWKKAHAAGHELGNHSLSHPCTGNYAFSAKNALEDYTLERMARNIDGANAEITRLLGVRPATFGYPCGQKFVGRGSEARSYVPLVAARFVAGRGYRDEAANDPQRCDLAQAMGIAIDELSAAQMLALVDEAAAQGRWLVLVTHEVGAPGFQTTDARAFDALAKYVKDPARGLWVDTVEAVANYIRKQRR